MTDQLTPEEQAELDRLQAKANQVEVAPDANKTKPKRKSAKDKRTPEEQAAHEAKVAETRKKNISKANAARAAKKIQAQGKTMDQLSEGEKTIVRNALRRTPDTANPKTESRTVTNLTEAEALELRFRKSPIGKITTAEQAKSLEGRWAEAFGGGAKIIRVSFSELQCEVCSVTILLSEGGKWTTQKELTVKAELTQITAIR